MSGPEDVINLVVTILIVLIFARVILSWLVMYSGGDFIIKAYQVIQQLTDPIMLPLRRIIPPIGMFDITPIVVILALEVIRAVLIAAVQ